MPFIPNLLKGFGSFAIITGVGDALIGTKMLEGLVGESLPVVTPADAITDSQIRFLGSTWAGFGAMMWWVANDIPSRKTPLALLLGAVFLGGIGRSLSVLLHGNATPLFLTFIGVELLGAPAVWLALQGTSSAVKTQ